MPQTAVSSQKLVASTPSSNKASSLCKSLRSTAPQVRMDLPPPTSLFLVREDSESRAGPHSPLLYYSQQLQSDSAGQLIQCGLRQKQSHLCLGVFMLAQHRQRELHKPPGRRRKETTHMFNRFGAPLMEAGTWQEGMPPPFP